MKAITTIIILVLVATGLVWILTQNSEQGEVTTSLSEISTETTAESTTRVPETSQEITPPLRETNTETQNMKAIITTTEGTIELELFDEKAPKTVDNFVSLAREGFYDGVKFHRVIQGFMIQSGDPLSKDEDEVDMWGTGGPGYTFEDEIHDENNNVVGTISMANAGPNTNGSQFFINTADNNFLDPKHTVFGRVVSGMDVVTAIEAVDTFPNDRPIEHVEITKIEIVN